MRPICAPGRQRCSCRGQKVKIFEGLCCLGYGLKECVRIEFERCCEPPCFEFPQRGIDLEGGRDRQGGGVGAKGEGLVVGKQRELLESQRRW